MQEGTEVLNNDWQVPEHELQVFSPRVTKYCLVIPVLNEGERLRSMLKKLKGHQELLDIIILDKGSDDGSTEPEFLRASGVRALLTLNEEGKLSSQLRMGYAYALREGYEGIVTIDGNDKDDVEALPNFVALLDQGYDFVQASRYIEGGEGVNTPLVRDLAIKLIHAPVISLLAGFHYTDTTQGYRAYSKQLLLDEKLAIFRDVFVTYELLAYLSVKAPRFGYKIIETPVKRTYPKGKKPPTKISFIKGNLELLGILLKLALNRYDKR